MLFAASITLCIIKYWSLLLVPVAVVVFVRPCRLRVRHQAWWTMVFLVCGMKGLAYEQFGGNALAPNLPETLVWFWNWADGGLTILVFLSLIWWVKKGRVWILPVLAWGLSAWGQYCGTVLPAVHEVELRYPSLPASLDGYRIVQISDLHCSSAARRWRTQAIVDRTNALDADLICLTGDYVDGLVDDLSEDLAPILMLKAKEGVCAVRGNHEYYADRRAWRAWYAAHGLEMLDNTCVFPHPGLAVGGGNDPQGLRWGDCETRPARTFAAATNGEFRVLLEHRPVHAAENIRDHGVDLQLSGHTHGGLAPLMDRVVASFNGGYVRGLYPIGNGNLYVSSGCGQWAGFPMRFFTPSEITLITLRR